MINQIIFGGVGGWERGRGGGGWVWMGGGGLSWTKTGRNLSLLMDIVCPHHFQHSVTRRTTKHDLYRILSKKLTVDEFVNSLAQVS